MIPSGHMPSIVPSILERDPPLFSPEGFFPFLPVKVFFSISWKLFLIRCEVKGQVCLYVQIVKPSEDNL